MKKQLAWAAVAMGNVLGCGNGSGTDAQVFDCVANPSCAAL